MIHSSKSENEKQIGLAYSLSIDSLSIGEVRESSLDTLTKSPVDDVVAAHVVSTTKREPQVLKDPKVLDIDRIPLEGNVDRRNYFKRTKHYLRRKLACSHSKSSVRAFVYKHSIIFVAAVLVSICLASFSGNNDSSTQNKVGECLAEGGLPGIAIDGTVLNDVTQSIVELTLRRTCTCVQPRVAGLYFNPTGTLLTAVIAVLVFVTLNRASPALFYQITRLFVDRTNSPFIFAVKSAQLLPRSVREGCANLLEDDAFFQSEDVPKGALRLIFGLTKREVDEKKLVDSDAKNRIKIATEKDAEFKKAASACREAVTAYCVSKGYSQDLQCFEKFFF